jgi:2-C-methyl-D-erythritol 4-phosphate cytidylyltransferase
MSSNAERYWAVVPAAGAGLRMGSKVPKQYLPLNGETVLQHTLAALLAADFIEQIVVALDGRDQLWETLPAAADSRVETVIGGAERSDSVRAGLEALAGRANPGDWVLVHDAARPCLSAAALERLREELTDSEVGGLLAVAVAETVKRGDEDQAVLETVDREDLWLAQTPQMFRFGLLQGALKQADKAGQFVTDESSAMELAGYRPQLVYGDPGNIKITRPGDLAFARAWLAAGEES